MRLVVFATVGVSRHQRTVVQLNGRPEPAALVPVLCFIIDQHQVPAVIQTETVENGLRLSTGPGEAVQLVIPALQYEAPEPPTFGISFSVVVNVSTFELVDGSVEVTPPEGAESLLSLASAGIPLDLTQLLFSRVGGYPALMASAKIAEPFSRRGSEVGERSTANWNAASARTRNCSSRSDDISSRLAKRQSAY